mmetsp:Transcript_43098/g.101231  ORF Transcript_43098/g.101231 Transcript_43098/m.101231 type:complete len:98 (+) Transcript_43098:2881-3174(+)
MTRHESELIFTHPGKIEQSQSPSLQKLQMICHSAILHIFFIQRLWLERSLFMSTGEGQPYHTISPCMAFEAHPMRQDVAQRSNYIVNVVLAPSQGLH